MFTANLKDSSLQKVTKMRDLKLGDIAEVLDPRYPGHLVTLIELEGKTLVLNLTKPVYTRDSPNNLRLNGWALAANLQVRILQPGEEIILKVTND